MTSLAGTGPRRRFWSLRWKVFGAFVLVSLLAPVLAAAIGQHLLAGAVLAQTRVHLRGTATSIARVLERPGVLAALERHPAAAGVHSRMETVVQVAGQAAGATVAVAVSGGRVVLSSGRDPAALEPWVHQVLRDGSLSAVGSRRAAAVLGYPAVVAASDVRAHGRVVGAVVVARPLREARRGAAFAQQLLLRSWAAGILLSLLLGVALAAGITRPLRAMAQAVEAISGGDFRQRVLVGPADEVGLLAAAFNRMAERLDRVLSARRELLAAISHELRTPLTSVQGFVSALREGLIAPEAAERTYDIIEGEIFRLRRLIDDLFELAKLEAGQVTLSLQEAPVAEMVEAAAERARVRVGRGGPEIAVELPAGVGNVWADPDRIFQVLDNLVQNATRFTPPPGPVTLRASRLPSGVRFEVEDVGPGIAAADRERVFERFYTAEPSRSRPAGGGTGLGLAIAREIVRAHGGTIGVESTPGRGSRFWFELPGGPMGRS